MGSQNGQIEVCLKSENQISLNNSVHYYLLVYIFKYYILIYQKLKLKNYIIYCFLYFIFIKNSIKHFFEPIKHKINVAIQYNKILQNIISKLEK